MEKIRGMDVAIVTTANTDEATMTSLREEKELLTARKNEQYESYSFARAKYRELQTIQANVQEILKNIPDISAEHSEERS